MGNEARRTNTVNAITSKTTKEGEIYRNLTVRKDPKRQPQTCLTIQLEEINQKILAKEERLKSNWDRVQQYKQNRTFQNNERKFYLQPDIKEAKQFWSKIREQKNIIEKPNGLITWKKNYKNSKKALRRTYTWNREERHKKITELEDTWLWWRRWILV